jgi:hypothetical protein
VIREPQNSPMPDVRPREPEYFYCLPLPVPLSSKASPLDERPRNRIIPNRLY